MNPWISGDQLEGKGWDGEYIKKGVRDKLMDLLEVEGMDKEELEEWVTEVFHCIDNCDFDEN